MRLCSEFQESRQRRSKKVARRAASGNSQANKASRIEDARRLLARLQRAHIFTHCIPDVARLATFFVPLARQKANPNLVGGISSSRHRALFIIMFAALFALLSFNAADAFAQRTRSRKPSSSSTSTLTVRSEPNAIVWLDEIRRGVTDDTGKLTLEKISAGRHTLRVRALGFKERTLALLPTQRGQIDVRLARTTDEAELTFQRAEEAREKAKDDDARKAAVELYRRALKLRPNFPAAHVGLARLLSDLNDYKSALSEIADARDGRPIYPEASAVEGRIYRSAAFWDDAIASFRRAIREAHGFQPEAHTGLALLYEEEGKTEEAAAEFRTAIAQLSDTEPVIYQLLGAAYEKMEKYKEAVAAYEKYLQLAPDGNLAPAVRSVIDQLRKQADEQSAQPNN